MTESIVITNDRNDPIQHIPLLCHFLMFNDDTVMMMEPYKHDQKLYFIQSCLKQLKLIQESLLHNMKRNEMILVDVSTETKNNNTQQQQQQQQEKQMKMIHMILSQLVEYEEEIEAQQSQSQLQI